MNDGYRLPVVAFCVAGIAGLIWMTTRESDINGLAGGIAVLAGICGFAGLAMQVMSNDED